MLSAVSSLPADPRLDRLRRLSRALAAATTIVMALLVLLSLGLWLNPSWVEATVAPRVGLSWADLTITPQAQLAGALITAVPLLVLVFGLDQVRRIFLGFAEGELISRALARRLEVFGAAVALQALLNPLAGALISIALTLANPPGRRMIALSLSSHDVVSVLVGVLIIAIGWVMREAARIAEEHAGFV